MGSTFCYPVLTVTVNFDCWEWCRGGGMARLNLGKGILTFAWNANENIS